MDQASFFDALLPPAMAQKAEDLGVRKAKLPFVQLFFLAFLAGAFIAMGAIFSTVVLSGATALPYGLGRMLAGLAFCLGLILVVVGGAELFTGNCLIIMAWANKKVTTLGLLRNWGIVYLGNLVGSVGTAVVMLLAKQYTFGSGIAGETALKIAVSKVNLGFVQAIALGMLCNCLVCLAIWMTFGAHSTTDKILAIIFPIAGFVAAGFEHSVANMYFIPYGLLVQQFDSAFVVSLGDKVNVASLSWESFFLNNLLPVTIGNIIGGSIMVGIIYYLIYLRGAKSTKTVEQKPT